MEAASFDLSAAYVRKAGGDLKAFMEGLAVRLEAALPGAVAVTRSRDGLFSSTSRATRIDVTAPGARLTLTLDHGALHARRGKIVRGVTIGSDEIAVPVWLDELTRLVGIAGADAEATRASLHDFLMS